LNDHLAGATIARQLLDVMQKQNEDEHFRLFAKNLLPQIEQDDQTLRSIIDKIHSSPGTLKQAGGWLLEKGARAKLGHARSTTFELFESLELLLLVFREKCFSGKHCAALRRETMSFAHTTLRSLFGAHRNSTRRSRVKESLSLRQFSTDSHASPSGGGRPRCSVAN
jgi:hypothetical protein